MDRITNSEGLFPTKASFLIFGSYISLFVSQTLLVTSVQRNQIYAFNAVIVVLLTEIVKLAICIAVYLWRCRDFGIGSWLSLWQDIKSNQRLLVLYLIPALLYCLYNNLTFINLELFDASTYHCLMQFRIVLTALIYQALFKRQLTIVQWSSLLILTAGCLIKQYGVYSNSQITANVNLLTSTTTSQRPLVVSPSNELNETKAAIQPTHMGFKNTHHHHHQKPPIKFLWASSMLIFQMFCSCFAGVYNEYLLKDSQTAERADVILQNMFMYIDSIACNLLLYYLWSPATSRAHQLVPPDGLGMSTILASLLTSPLVLILIVNNALSGLVASFFLKSLNSILKTFAAALELFAVTFFAWLLFSNRVDWNTIIALVLVLVAIVIYSRNPVNVAPPGRPNARQGKRIEAGGGGGGSGSGFVLLPMDEEGEDS